MQKYVKSIRLGNNYKNYYLVFLNILQIIHDFQKKTQKTPSNEIGQAEKLKQQYFNEKI
jgi:phage-related protein